MTNTRVSRLIAVLLVLSIFTGIAAFVRPMRDQVRHVHTGFLFLQLDTACQKHLADGGQLPDSEESFYALAAEWKSTIDWNSCSMPHGVILDVWKTPIQVHIEQYAIALRSAGYDRTFQTGDDITASIASLPDRLPRLAGRTPIARQH